MENRVSERISKLTRPFKGVNAKKLAGNFFSLSFMQAVSSLVQLITIPVLTGALGVSEFGVLSASLAATAYFLCICDYGFNLTATRDVAIHKGNPAILNSIFSSVMVARLVIALVGLGLFGCIVFFVPQFRDHYMVYLCAFPMVLGQALFPSWFYQGIEKMRVVSIVNIITKLLYAFCVFGLVRQGTPTYMVNVYNAASFMLTGCVALLLAYTKYGIDFRMPSGKEVRHQIIDGWHTFITYFMNNLFVTSNIIILQFFAPATAVGYYAVVDKLVSGLRQLYNVTFQVTYPHASALYVESKDKLQRFLTKVVWQLAAVYAIIAALVVISAPLIIVILVKNVDIESSAYLVSVTTLRVMVFIPFCLAFNLKGYQNVLLYQRKQLYATLFMVVLALSIMLNVILSYTYGGLGTAFAALITEAGLSAALLVIDRLMVSKRSIMGLNLRANG